MAEYLALIAETSGATTVEDPAKFISILNDAHEAAVNDHHLEQIVENASEECRVDDITDVPQPVWTTLAATKRMAPSARNVLAYLDKIGALDDSASVLLTDVEALEQPDRLPDADRIRVAVAILGARQTIASAAHRVRLAASLKLPSPIPTTSFTPEPGELVGMMIEAGLLSDDETTFASALMVDWPTREAALVSSHNAMAFVSPISIPPDQLSSFFHSTKVPMPMKEEALSKLSALIPNASQESIRTVASFAAASGIDIGFATIDQLRAAGALDQDIVALLATSSTLTLDEMRVELRALQNPYPLLADHGNSRPVVPDDDAHQRVLNRLRAGNIVSDHKPDRGGRRVFLRKA